MTYGRVLYFWSPFNVAALSSAGSSAVRSMDTR